MTTTNSTNYRMPFKEMAAITYPTRSTKWQWQGGIERIAESSLNDLQISSPLSLSKRCAHNLPITWHGHIFLAPVNYPQIQLARVCVCTILHSLHRATAYQMTAAFQASGARKLIQQQTEVFFTSMAMYQQKFGKGEEEKVLSVP